MNPSSNHPRRRVAGGLYCTVRQTVAAFRKTSLWDFRVRGCIPRKPTGVLSGIGLCLFLAGVSRAQGPVSLVVESGSQVTLLASGTYGKITVTGTGNDGQPSTFTAAAPLLLTGTTTGLYDVLAVDNGGLFKANADVVASDPIRHWAAISSGGSLELNSGTFTMGEVYLSGSTAFSRTGGAYAVRHLGLGNSASVSYTTADSFVSGSNAQASIGLSSGATLSLARDLVGVNLTITDTSTGIIRNGHALDVKTIRVAYGANLALGDTDEFTGLSVDDNASSITLPSISAMPTVNVDYLVIGGTIAGLQSRPFTTRQLGVTGGQSVVLRSGSITDTVGEVISIAGNTVVGGETAIPSTLNLTRSITLSGSYGSYPGLHLRGVGATLNTNGYSVTTPEFHIRDGASWTLGYSVITNDFYVESLNFAPTTLTLDRNLVLNGTEGKSAGIRVTGTGAQLVRLSGVTITGSNASMDFWGSNFTFVPGDTLIDSVISARGPGVIANSGTFSIDWLNVGSGLSTGTYSINGPLTVAMAVVTNAALNVNAATFAGNITVTADTNETSAVNLISGVLSATSLAFSGSGSGVTRAYGSYSVTNLTLTDHAALTYATLDSIANLSLTDSSLTASKPLGLDTLSITGDSLLILQNFSGDGPGDIAWGLMVDGNQTATLDTWILASRIIASSELDTVYDSVSNATYVTAVPEPATVVLAGFGITSLARVIRRRLRARAPENS